MTELLDIYDENMTHIGTKPRASVHRDGDWHRVFHCWVIYRDANGQDWVILQKRGPDKDTFPLYLDISAAGHYAAGETVREAMRELEEELGLSPDYDELIPLGIRIGAIKYKQVIDRQFADVFMYVCDQPLTEYRYQHEEIIGLIALNARQGLRLLAGEIDYVESPVVGIGSDTLSVTRDMFIPTLDYYWRKILLLATRCLNGEDHLYI